MQVQRLLNKGYQPRQIAKRLGVAPGTVSFHLRRLGVRVGHGYCGRRVMVEILGRSGVRVSELCDLRIGQLRLHGRDGGRFQVLDSKTETGIREVQMTPDLAAAVGEHIAHLRRLGAPTGPRPFWSRTRAAGAMIVAVSLRCWRRQARKPVSSSSKGPPAAAQHHAAHAAAHLYLDRAAGEQL